MSRANRIASNHHRLRRAKRPPLLAGLLILTTAQFLGAAAPRSPGTIIGRAETVDGDTIDIARIRVRLHGIDAPEVGQKCRRDDGKRWSCGKTAKQVLARLIGGRVVRCDARAEDAFGRPVAVCHVGEIDISARMIVEGMAWAFIEFSGDYVDLETRARNLRVGIWRGTSEPPWAYRARRWKLAEQQAPEGCPIKGNISKLGRIYHAPWSPWYKRTRVSPEKGERWFCSEREARDAGWRPPK